MVVEILFGAFSAPKRLGMDSPPEGNAQKKNIIIAINYVGSLDRIYETFFGFIEN